MVTVNIVEWLNSYNSSTCEELYFKLEYIHKEYKPVESEHVPFSLEDLNNLECIQDSIIQDIDQHLCTYWSAFTADILIRASQPSSPSLQLFTT